MTISRSVLHQYLEQLTELQLQQVAALVTRLMHQRDRAPETVTRSPESSGFMRFAAIAAEQSTLLQELEDDVVAQRHLDWDRSVDL